MRKSLVILFLTMFSVLSSCRDDDPDASDGGISDASVDGGVECTEEELAYVEDVTGCTTSITDYTPREQNSATDGWVACISDDNIFHRIEESITSIARVEAYETIAGLLWDNPSMTPQDFLDARSQYQIGEGLDSRVVRRYDPHYDPPPGDVSCEDVDIPAQYPDYCVGPATLQPALLDAFNAGINGQDMIVSAYMIRAALQWFFYVSANKEATTCFGTPKDCDSCWAYYSGGTPRETPIGLAADIDWHAPETHDRVYDGVLALRCWRDLDPSVPADNVTLQELAIDQMDRALLRGMAIIIRQHFVELTCSTKDYREGAHEALRFLIQLFDRETRDRNPIVADLLLTEIAKQVEQVNVDEAIEAIDSLYPCP